MKKINYTWQGVQFLNSRSYRNEISEGFNDDGGKDIFIDFIEYIENEKPDIDYVCTTVVKQCEQWAENNLEEIKHAEIEEYDSSLILLNENQFIYSIKTDEYWIIFFNDDNNGMLFINPSPENIPQHPLLLKAKCIIYWLQNQEHDIIYVNHAKKHRTANDEPELFNLSGHSIYIINTRLNKTVIHDEPFPVKGFWRKQRCGKGNAFVKDVFINEFMKKGYKRTYHSHAA